MDAPRRLVPLAPLLALLTAGPLVVVVVLTGALSLRAGERLVQGTVHDLQREVAAGVVAAVQRTLEPPHLLNALNDDLLADGLLDPTDPDRMQQVFHRELMRQPSVGYVQLGTVDGRFVGVERTGDGFRVERTDGVPEGKGVWDLGTDGRTTGPLVEHVSGYDPTTRPWFRAARHHDGPTWSAVYQFSSTDEVRLGITAVQPWSVEGEVQGVLGADIVLTQLGKQLAAANLRGGARVFLVERDGALVAHSRIGQPFAVDADRVAHRLHADRSDDAATAAVARHLLPHLPDLAAPLFLQLPLDDDLTFVHAVPITDGRGIDWVAVVAMPRADFTPELRTFSLATLALALCATALAVLLGAFVARRVGGPILQLTRAADALAQGQDHPLPRSRMTELERLASAFARMRTDLDQRQRELADARDQALVAQRAAEEASRAKSFFLANMSHELRTPLNAIIGYSELLSEAPDSPDREADLERIRSAGRHLLGLVADVLDLTRIETGQLALDLAEVDVAELVREVTEPLRGLVEGHGNRLVVRTPDRPVPAAVDATKLRQCIVNLVGNAAKFTRDGTVEVSLTTEAGQLVIAVRDTGIGIPAPHLLTLFAPFAQVQRSDRQGAGLGLAITREFARAMGGDVTVESREGEGSLFRVELPRHP